MEFPRKNSVLGQFSVKVPLPNPLQAANFNNIVVSASLIVTGKIARPQCPRQSPRTRHKLRHMLSDMRDTLRTRMFQVCGHVCRHVCGHIRGPICNKCCKHCLRVVRVKVNAS